MPSRPIEELWLELAANDPDMLWGIVSELLTNPEFSKEPESKPAAEGMMRDYLHMPPDEIERIINDPARLAEHYLESSPAQS